MNIKTIMTRISGVLFAGMLFFNTGIAHAQKAGISVTDMVNTGNKVLNPYETTYTQTPSYSVLSDPATTGTVIGYPNYTEKTTWTDDYPDIIEKIEWTDKDKGEALLTVQTNADIKLPKREYAVAVLTDCTAHGFSRDIAYREISALCTRYKHVDVLIPKCDIKGYPSLISSDPWAVLEKGAFIFSDVQEKVTDDMKTTWKYRTSFFGKKSNITVPLANKKYAPNGHTYGGLTQTSDNFAALKKGQEDWLGVMHAGYHLQLYQYLLLAAYIGDGFSDNDKGINYYGKSRNLTESQIKDNVDVYTFVDVCYNNNDTGHVGFNSDNMDLVGRKYFNDARFDIWTQLIEKQDEGHYFSFGQHESGPNGKSISYGFDHANMGDAFKNSKWWVVMNVKSCLADPSLASRFDNCGGIDAQKNSVRLGTLEAMSVRTFGGELEIPHKQGSISTNDTDIAKYYKECYGRDFGGTAYDLYKKGEIKGVPYKEDADVYGKINDISRNLRSGNHDDSNGNYYDPELSLKKLKNGATYRNSAENKYNIIPAKGYSWGGKSFDNMDLLFSASEVSRGDYCYSTSSGIAHAFLPYDIDISKLFMEDIQKPVLEFSISDKWVSGTPNIYIGDQVQDGCLTLETKTTTTPTTSGSNAASWGWWGTRHKTCLKLTNLIYDRDRHDEKFYGIDDWITVQIPLTLKDSAMTEVKEGKISCLGIVDETIARSAVYEKLIEPWVGTINESTLARHPALGLSSYILTLKAGTGISEVSVKKSSDGVVEKSSTEVSVMLDEKAGATMSAVTRTGDYVFYGFIPAPDNPDGFKSDRRATSSTLTMPAHNLTYTATAYDDAKGDNTSVYYKNYHFMKVNGEVASHNDTNYAPASSLYSGTENKKTYSTGLGAFTIREKVTVTADETATSISESVSAPEVTALVPSGLGDVWNKASNTNIIRYPKRIRGTKTVSVDNGNGGKKNVSVTGWIDNPSYKISSADFWYPMNTDLYLYKIIFDTNRLRNESNVIYQLHKDDLDYTTTGYDAVVTANGENKQNKFYVYYYSINGNTKTGNKGIFYTGAVPKAYWELSGTERDRSYGRSVWPDVKLKTLFYQGWCKTKFGDQSTNFVTKTNYNPGNLTKSGESRTIFAILRDNTSVTTATDHTGWTKENVTVTTTVTDPYSGADRATQDFYTLVNGQTFDSSPTINSWALVNSEDQPITVNKIKSGTYSKSTTGAGARSSGKLKVTYDLQGYYKIKSKGNGRIYSDSLYPKGSVKHGSAAYAEDTGHTIIKRDTTPPTVTVDVSRQNITSDTKFEVLVTDPNKGSNYDSERDSSGIKSITLTLTAGGKTVTYTKTEFDIQDYTLNPDKNPYKAKTEWKINLLKWGGGGSVTYEITATDIAGNTSVATGGTPVDLDDSDDDYPDPTKGTIGNASITTKMVNLEKGLEGKNYFVPGNKGYYEVEVTGGSGNISFNPESGSKLKSGYKPTLSYTDGYEWTIVDGDGNLKTTNTCPASMDDVVVVHYKITALDAWEGGKKNCVQIDEDAVITEENGEHHTYTVKDAGDNSISAQGDYYIFNLDDMMHYRVTHES